MFKQKIIDKYAKSLDETKLKAAYENFKVYQAKAEAIKGFKEEEYQDGFLRDVFELCLGYTLKTTNPSGYDLSRERKNETDGKKADGAITIDSEVVALIELKDQNTKNLDAARKGELSPVDQCFRYLNSHQKAKYAIVSNFDELRLYVGKKTEYEKYNLFSLDFDGFKRLYLVMSFESIKSGLTARLKEETDSFEKQISKELYRDYSLFRSRLFDDIRTNNTHMEPHKLLRLTQTLCDRIIFILFAEDRGLLNKNTIREIREEFRNQKFTSYTLYDIYKFYFEAINNGNDKLSIAKYNGGLFAENAELDSLKISDERLDMQAQKLSDYDFESDISVNILGHIFEQSLTDLEELSASIGGEALDKSKSKRKKDGVFYTPEYITRYIVANTLGKLCEQKRDELGISSQIEPPKNPKKLTKAEETAKSALQEYREWLKTLKICDPACGSGAFLNQALEYLISEHKSTAQQIVYFGDLTATEDIEKSILEHNLYGVDINEEAVEIARLSLWLRTASKGRKLTNLTEKIKVGNSLISDKSVDEGAFDWKAEFAEVFEHGGFDVIIGNPPYVRQEMLGVQAKSYFAKNYATYHGMADLYVFFVERGYELLKPNGKFSYIFPNKWMRAGYGKALRKYLLDKRIDEIIDFGDLPVFEDATTYPIILSMTRADAVDEFSALEMKNLDFGDLAQYVSENASRVPSRSLSEDGFALGGENAELLERVKQNSITLGEYVKGEAYRGVATGLNEAFVIDEATRAELIRQNSKSEEIIKPFLAGRDIKRYETPKAENYLLFIPWHFPLHNDPKISGASIEAEEAFKNQYPAVYTHLCSFKEKLEARNKAETGIRYEWYALQRCAASYYQEFEKVKIMYQVFQVKPSFVLDKSGTYCNNAIWMLPTNDKVLLAILNSKIGWTLISSYCTAIQNGYQLIWKYLEQIPIPKDISSVQREEIEKLVDEQISHVDKLNTLNLEFKSYLNTVLNVIKIPSKLDAPQNMSFDELKTVLEKSKVDMKDISIFRSVKQMYDEMLGLQKEIDARSEDIDKNVNALYGI